MHLSFTVILRQWGQYSRTYCGCAANSPLIKVCVCFTCAPRTQNTHKLLLQLGVAAGDPPVRGYCPCCLRYPIFIMSQLSTCHPSAGLHPRDYCSFCAWNISCGNVPCAKTAINLSGRRRRPFSRTILLS